MKTISVGKISKTTDKFEVYTEADKTIKCPVTEMKCGFYRKSCKSSYCWLKN